MPNKSTCYAKTAHKKSTMAGKDFFCSFCVTEMGFLHHCGVLCVFSQKKSWHKFTSFFIWPIKKLFAPSLVPLILEEIIKKIFIRQNKKFFHRIFWLAVLSFTVSFIWPMKKFFPPLLMLLIFTETIKNLLWTKSKTLFFTFTEATFSTLEILTFNIFNSLEQDNQL